eukprot:1368061-Amorphochlora_amoeboformis.AAC.1
MTVVHTGIRLPSFLTSLYDINDPPGRRVRKGEAGSHVTWAYREGMRAMRMESAIGVAYSGKDKEGEEEGKENRSDEKGNGEGRYANLNPGEDVAYSPSIRFMDVAPKNNS